MQQLFLIELAKNTNTLFHSGVFGIEKAFYSSQGLPATDQISLFKNQKLYAASTLLYPEIYMPDAIITDTLNIVFIHM